MAKLTTRMVRDLNNLITKNSNLFTPGNVITEKQLCKMASIKHRAKFTTMKDAQAYSLQKVKFYTAVNRLLAKRGLYVKARDYYTSFVVLEKEDVPVRSKQFKKCSETAAVDSKLLDKGKRLHRCKWKTLGPREQMEVVDRLEGKINRIKI